ncbi:nectin-4-like [Clupea harengus]|uniref:Nectin-4-like n=1 Tax=Clupea harengus TaxID=7950 RepID=A0A6P8EVD1_CLUHA|nr:nectin-4-like [Clupea harengus]
MGADKGELQVTVRELQRHEAPVDTFPTIIVGGVAGALVVVMVIVIIIVTHHHKRKNRKLKRELSDRTEEINNLSRQTSLRRLNSASTDLRSQMDDVSIRMDSMIKNNVMSLEECSALHQPPGGVSEQDLERPLYPGFHPPRDGNSWRERQREESQRRLEAYLKSSNHSLDSGLPSSLVPPLSPEAPVLEMEPRVTLPRCTGGQTQPWASREGVVDGQTNGWSPHVGVVDGQTGQGWLQRDGVAEGEEDEDASSSLQISEALSNHFHYSNGFLRPKAHPNAILLHPRGQII